jgi:hypothetical protein
MKLVRFYLEKIDNVELFALIAFGIFFVFFILIGIRVIRMKKSFIHKMSHAPLDDDDSE